MKYKFITSFGVVIDLDAEDFYIIVRIILKFGMSIAIRFVHSHTELGLFKATKLVDELMELDENRHSV